MLDRLGSEDRVGLVDEKRWRVGVGSAPMERYTAEGLPLVVMIGRWQHIERLDDAFLDVDVAHTRRNLDSILSLIRSCAAGVRFDRRLVLGERWQSLKTPTLFVRGERDVFMRPRAEKAWETRSPPATPNIRVVRLPDAGHLPWLDDPESVVAEIERFLAMEPPSGVEAAAQSPRRSTS